MNEWIERQVYTSQQLIEHARQALQGGNIAVAEESVVEALAIIDMALGEAPGNLDILRVKAKGNNELGFLFHRSERLDRALDLHNQTLELCNQMVESGEEFRANTAACHINISSVLVGLDRDDEARSHSEKAITISSSLIDDEEDLVQARNIAFGARHSLAVNDAKASNFDAALDHLEKGLKFITYLRENGAPGIDVQAAQTCQQISVLLFENDRFDDASDIGKSALDFSEKAYETIGEQTIPVYLTSQMNLISYYEKQGNYSGAEDSLWKSLDFIGDHPQILERGKAFYETCRNQADTRLEKGGLPREEVEEGLREINERITKIGGISEEE